MKILLGIYIFIFIAFAVLGGFVYKKDYEFVAERCPDNIEITQEKGRIKCEWKEQNGSEEEWREKMNTLSITGSFNPRNNEMTFTVARKPLYKQPVAYLLALGVVFFGRWLFLNVNKYIVRNKPLYQSFSIFIFGFGYLQIISFSLDAYNLGLPFLTGRAFALMFMLPLAYSSYYGLKMLQEGNQTITGTMIKRSIAGILLGYVALVASIGTINPLGLIDIFVDKTNAPQIAALTSIIFVFLFSKYLLMKHLSQNEKTLKYAEIILPFVPLLYLFVLHIR